MDRTRPAVVNDVELIAEGLIWLSDNIGNRDNTEEPIKSNSYAVRYANTQLRVVRRILDYVASQEDVVVIVCRKLLELELHPDIKDLAMIALCGKRPIESFSKYENLLIGKVIFGEGSKWA
jgi:hypothetical protein